MSKKLSSADKYRLIVSDPVLWIENFVDIVDKEGKTVKFKFNPLQRNFVENMEKYSLILKSRQLGFSSVSCALSLYYACTEANSECLLVSYSIDSATAIFEKLKQMYYSIPEVIRPKYLRNSKKEIKLSNGSRIIVATCGSKDLGRGMTLKFAHMSEIAFWRDNADKQLLAIEQALRPDARIVLESTSNGLNHWSELYNKSSNGENMYKSFFYNWVDGGCMFTRDYKEAVEIWKARNNDEMLTTDELDEYEQMLVNNYEASLEQVVWRRLKISNSGEDQFKQEFPLTPIESFLSTGSTIFDNTRVDKIEKELALKVKNKTDFIRKNKLKKPLTQMLNNHYGKSLFIYHEPIEKQKYYAGVDTAEGLGGSRDYSVIVILDKQGREVAMFRNNKLKPHNFALALYDLALYFNGALLTIEKASGGHTVISKLFDDLKYMNISTYETYDERNKRKYEIGFNTNAKTKSLIINDYREWFDEGLVEINSKTIIEEMKTFEANNGTFNARTGSHDDTIISICLAIAGIKSGQWYKLKNKK
jgi:hypothetical protein